MGPADLDQALCGLEIPFDANILAGVAGSEDAGVYRLSDDLALVQTVDFFTPIVDDPRIFGRVAAANSLSDVYAMGGRPITAMNVVCFPSKKLGIAVLRGILEGGLDILKQAGVALVGGHSVDDDEPKYGLSVSGLIHPDRIMTNSGLKPGDRLVLTKAVGTGVIATASKADLASLESTDAMVRSMCALNKEASEVAVRAGVRACTDITGFGLGGASGRDGPSFRLPHQNQSPFSPDSLGSIGSCIHGNDPCRCVWQSHVFRPVDHHGRIRSHGNCRSHVRPADVRRPGAGNSSCSGGCLRACVASGSGGKCRGNRRGLGD